MGPKKLISKVRQIQFDMRREIESSYKHLQSDRKYTAMDSIWGMDTKIQKGRESGQSNKRMTA